VSTFFHDGTNSPAAARKFYETLLAQKGLTRLGRRALGYGSLGLVYAFAHAAPNASLPILWVHTDSWRPLFDR
jgi:hypothetical protein